MISDGLKKGNEARPLALLEFKLSNVPVEVVKTLSDSFADSFRKDLVAGLAEEGVRFVEKPRLARALKEILDKNPDVTRDELIRGLNIALPEAIVVFGTISSRTGELWRIRTQVYAPKATKPIVDIVHYFERTTKT